jgi:hypothetical protein
VIPEMLGRIRPGTTLYAFPRGGGHGGETIRMIEQR